MSFFSILESPFVLAAYVVAITMIGGLVYETVRAYRSCRDRI